MKEFSMVLFIVQCFIPAGECAVQFVKTADSDVVYHQRSIIEYCKQILKRRTKIGTFTGNILVVKRLDNRYSFCSRLHINAHTNNLSDLIHQKSTIDLCLKTVLI